MLTGAAGVGQILIFQAEPERVTAEISLSVRNSETWV